MIDNNPWSDFSKSRSSKYDNLKNKIKDSIKERELKINKDKKQSSYKNSDRDHTLDVYG